ncbi:LytTR family DNA-binding domain-containing protein [soil metagenome]
MAKPLILAVIAWLAWAAPALARPPGFVTSVKVCAADARDLRACRLEVTDQVDPQGRLIWLVAPAPMLDGVAKSGATMAVSMAAIASSEVYINGVLIGRNGRPGPDKASEIPGLLDVAIVIPPGLLRERGNVIAVRMSSFHSVVRLSQPVSGIAIGPFSPTARLNPFWIGPPLLAAGVLLAGGLYFGVLYWTNRSRSSLLLSAIALTTAGQAAAEVLRPLWAYPYPVQAWRLLAVLAFAWVFSMLLPAFLAERLMRKRRGLIVGVAAAASTVMAFVPTGFDTRTAGVLLIGAVCAGLPAVVGAFAGKREARFAVVCLAAYLALMIIAPFSFLDIGFFMLAATLTTVLMIAEVTRLRRVDSEREVSLLRASTEPDRLSVSTARGVELIRLDDICAITGADDYAEVRLADGRVLLHAARLDHLEANLPGGFARIHRSTIVNLAQAERLFREAGRAAVEMADGARYPVSRARLSRLRDRFDLVAVGQGLS